jgi:hypothetical protein
MASQSEPSTKSPRNLDKPREPAPEPRDGLTRLKDAAAAYAAGLLQLSASLQEAQQQAAQSYLEAVGGSLKPGHLDPVSDAYQQLVQAIQGQDASQIGTAQAAYADTVKAFHGDIEGSVKAALETYTGALRSSWSSTNEEARRAYTDCLKAIKAAIGDLQEESTDPASLVLIGQSLCAVGGLAIQAAAAPTAAAKGGAHEPAGPGA